MDKTILSTKAALAAAMHYYAFLNDQDVVEMVLSLPSVISDPHYIVIGSNDQSLVGKKYNRQTGQFEDIMFYYAVLNDKDIVTQVIALEAEVTDAKKILLLTYDQSLVGKWYNRATGQFTELPIHVLAKLNTGEINVLNADGTPEDKWLQTKLDEIDTKVSQVESKCITDNAAKFDEVNTKITQVETKCLGDSKTKFDDVSAKITQVETKCLADSKTKIDGVSAKITQVETKCLADSKTKFDDVSTKITQAENRCNVDSATKFNYLNTKISQVENGSFGGYKAYFKIQDNQLMTSDWDANGKRFTFYFSSGISGYFPKMIRLVNKSSMDGVLFKADLYIVKNADGSIKHSYADKEYICRADSSGKIKKQYGQSNDNSLFTVNSSRDDGGSYFIGSLPSQYFEVNIGQFTYTENSISFTIYASGAAIGNYTSMSFYAFVY